MTEQEIQELREQVKRGRIAKIAIDFLADWILTQRARTISMIESANIDDTSVLQACAAILQSLKVLENSAQTQIDLGDIAEKELNEHGE